ncbi:hypothetical protein HDF22_005500 [Mucilaginibacter lappiensis]|uniref:Uncharacterized protein n=1 Tax=Mucilaginibacter lappiensis TaxID=354630 RepID=A0A841JJJ4_9SPHI|nr:hypothetical protein [Mucilaginibacter lappiensis]
MDKPYLVIKQHLNEYLHKTFESIKEANAAVNHSDDFPGEYACVYDLKLGKYIHIENFPGITDQIKHIILYYKNKK